MSSRTDLSDAEPNDSHLSSALPCRSLFDHIRGFVGDVVGKIGGAVSNNFKEVADVVKQEACDVFAALGLLPYLGYARAFRVKNPTGKSTSKDQNFFLYPIHGDLLRSSQIRIHYNSKFPFGFGAYSGATFGRHIYLTESARYSGAKFTVAFRNQVQLLIHELEHCRQYQTLGWSLQKFGLKYLGEFCKAGFSYEKNVMEKDAYAIEDDVDQLLFTDLGRHFFQVWRDHNLFSALGYPIRKTYTYSSPSIHELEFEKGVLQISSPGSYRYGRKATIGQKAFTLVGTS